MIGINESSLSHYIDGNRELNSRILRKLQHVVCEIIWLLSGGENPQTIIADMIRVNESPIQRQGSTISNIKKADKNVELDVLVK